MILLEEACRGWARLGLGTPKPITVGLINLTYAVPTADGGRVALQRLSPIFGAEVHRDIDAVTRHLEAKGLTTPRLVPTDAGALDLQLEDGCWRVMSWIEGETFERLDGPDHARAAGALLGRFHAALADFDTELVHVRVGVHDTEKHLAGLEAALAAVAGDPAHAATREVGERILELTAALPDFSELPRRVVHGDPKVSNLLFAPDGAGVAMVDLDTVARMPLAHELGDALRSWCNRAFTEDDARAQFDLDLMEATLEGYAKSAPADLSAAEWASLVPGAQTIMLELAARFCKDVVEDRYFGWDARRFPSRAAHNLARARGQLRLAESLETLFDAAKRSAEKLFPS